MATVRSDNERQRFVAQLPRDEALPPQRSTRLVLTLRAFGLAVAIAFFCSVSLGILPVLFLIIALPILFLSTRGRGGTRAWFLTFAGIILFLILRARADDVGFPLHTKDLQHLETVLCFGWYPTLSLQQALFTPGSLSVVDRAAAWIYWSYFVVPYLALLGVWVKSPRKSAELALYILTTFFLGLFVYVLAPATPPWLASRDPTLPHVWRIMEFVAERTDPALYHRVYERVGDPNPTAALPSLHFAITFVLFLFAWNSDKLWCLTSALYAIAMALALIYLGEHYTVDVMLGGLTAFAAVRFGSGWIRTMAEQLS